MYALELCKVKGLTTSYKYSRWWRL